MSVLTVLKGFRWFKPYIEICRIESWLSWVFGFALGAIFFSSPLLGQAIAIFFAFSFATASIFILNQYFDRQADAKNRLKSNLPIASRQISPCNALIFSFLLIISCFILVYITDINLSLPLFLYLALWAMYSAPTPRLKAIPVIDFLTAGVGAGFLPFFIGSSVTIQSSSNISLIILATIPLILFHCGAHIIQTIGDYEADQEAGINTFVVRYGRKKGVTIAGLTFTLAFLFPFIYLFTGSVSPSHLVFFTMILLLSIPLLLRFEYLYKNPCSSNVISLKKSVKKYVILALTFALIYVLMMKSVFIGFQLGRIIYL
jgi:4-hydroxybenzoate polyprenyltransferase